MKKHGLIAKIVAATLVVALQALFVPVSAESQEAALSGTVVASGSLSPMPGVKLHAADPKTGTIYTSGVTGPDGSFEVRDLPSSTYELAVESGEVLYVVGTPVKLAPGEMQTVNVAVNSLLAPGEESTKKKNKGGTSVWNNPGVAAGIIVASAFVLGAIVNQGTKETGGSEHDL